MGTGTSWEDAIEIVVDDGEITSAPITAADLPAGDGQPYYSAWFTFTPSRSLTVTLDTYQSTPRAEGDVPDTILVLYGGTTDPTVQLAQNDDAVGPHEYLSQLRVSLKAGVEYHLRVGTWSDDLVDAGVGDYVLHFAPSDWVMLSEPVFDEDTSDDMNLIEAGLCRLPGTDIVIVGGQSGYSYSIHLWAIDTSQDPVRIGPLHHVFSHGNDWMVPPLPDDPAGSALSDFSAVVGIDSRTFGLVGRPNENMNSDGLYDEYGTYYHLASFWDVDPDTLAITRKKLVLFDEGTPGNWAPFPNEANAAAWGDKLVISSDNESVIWVASQDGTFRTIDLPDSVPSPSALAVSRDYALFLSSPTGVWGDYNLARVSLVDGSVTVVPMPSVGDENWTFFATTLPNGKVAFSSPDNLGETDLAPVWLHVVDPDTLTIEGPYRVADQAPYAGWTGGWYSNLRSVSSWPDGTVLAGWVDEDRYPAYAALQHGSVTPAVIFDEIGNVRPNWYEVFIYQLVGLEQDRIAALWASPQWDDYSYGLFFYVTPRPQSAIDGEPLDDRRRFWQ